MARGQKHNDDIKEKARALLAANNNISEVARELGVPRSTIRDWKKEFENGEQKDEFAKLRHEKKEKFVNDAWNVIETSLRVLNAKLQKAVDDNDLVSAKDLAVIIGTLYDKQALASNEATQNLGGNVAMKWEDFA